MSFFSVYYHILHYLHTSHTGFIFFTITAENLFYTVNGESQYEASDISQLDENSELEHLALYIWLLRHEQHLYQIHIITRMKITS